MQVYALQNLQGEYLLFNKRCQLPYFSLSSAKFTNDAEKAKHYKSESIANATLTRAITERLRLIDNYTLQMATHSGNSRLYCQRNIGALQVSIDFIKNLSPIMVDVPAPNHTKLSNHDIRFAEKRKLGFKTKKSQGNMYCKCCGIYFQNIPLLQFGKCTPAKICPLCFIEHVKDAQALLDAMPEDRREVYINERFVNML
jgi:hypothetical protein